MKKHVVLFALMILAIKGYSQVTDPAVTSWIINTGSQTGYNGLPSNCQLIQYSTANVYVSCSCIPNYSIGPWNANPNTPSNQNFVFKITRTPQQNTGTATKVGLGQTGVWSNGVVIFNPWDGFHWDNTSSSYVQGPGTTWNRNALYYEGISFDSCLGHPAPSGAYHHHVNPQCLYNVKDSTHHSPIIGYAFDGFPIYGAYAYTNANGTGAIKRMRSSYVLSTASSRTAGPPVNATYPLGCLCEDYVYTPGSGDLDDHNGRFCITPEYPAGTYAYFVTIDANLAPVYPFVTGPTYYGTVQTGNTAQGPGNPGGHNTISETVTTYTPPVLNEVQLVNQKLDFLVYPSPTNEFLHVFIQPIFANDFTLELYDLSGQLRAVKTNVHPTIVESMDIRALAPGTYVLKAYNADFSTQQKVVIVH